MKKVWIIPIVIILSIIFNIGFVFLAQTGNDTPSWIFVDVGPAVMQDSYYIRSPGLETPFGMIGDIPGGYPLYSGNPLQSGDVENATLVSDTINWNLRPHTLDVGSILLASMFAVIPMGLIVIMGKRSYGSTKTQ